MSEIFSLAEKFKIQSEKQAEIIEQEVENATTQLNSFMTAKLQESEAIIKQGMESLDTSNEQLLTTLAKHQTDMSTDLDTYMSNVQAHTVKHLNLFAKDLEKTIEAYTQHIAEMIEQREDRIAKVIKSEMRKWLIAASLGALAMLLLGLILGASLVNKYSKPIYINQQIQPQPQMQQPSINYGQR
ncbi:MbeB family mobilization protein [Psychrobacter sp. ASPA161_9]|uniref:MbeB family mobilization protein n=1 Tax=Psychrobacter sp. ASPA161_9 TaxID=3160961 RepID=UPI003F81FD60